MPIILPMFLGVGWLGVECQVMRSFAAAARRLQATYQPRFGDKLSPISRRCQTLVPGWPVLGRRGEAGLTGVQDARIISLYRLLAAVFAQYCFHLQPNDMASDVPVIKQVAWVSIVPQVLVMGIIVAACYAAGVAEPFLYGPLIYLIISYLLRNYVAKAHRQGIDLVKRKDFRAAIPCFEASYHYFTQKPWVDKYRYFTLLSSSRMTYREMALCNIAFCYSQLGDGEKAVRYYEQVLADYPANGLAQAGLKMLESTKKQVD
jgi:tetratricopeptide (TPR) repeat protein